MSAASGTLERRRRGPHPAIVAAIGVSWTLAVVAEATGRGRDLHHDALLQGGLPLWAALLVFLVAWQAMIAAMMIPSSLPLIVLFERASSAQPDHRRARVAFLGGYAAVWTGFGAAAFVGDFGIHRLVHAWPWLAAHSFVIPGGALLLAGAFQFSDLKEKCLTECRLPSSYLMKHYRRGVRAAFDLGTGHGLFCLGCCWALMLVGFAAGVANLWWMAALTALMVVEKSVRGGARVVAPVGWAMIALGVLVLAHPAWLPSVFAA